MHLNESYKANVILKNCYHYKCGCDCVYPSQSVPNKKYFSFILEASKLLLVGLHPFIKIAYHWVLGSKLEEKLM